MNIAIIGTGYVGLVVGTCLSEIGNNVICIDIDQSKISKLSRGQCTIYEPGLDDLLKNNIKAGRLNFSTSYQDIFNSDIIFLAVNTPSNEDGTANLQYLYNSGESIAENFKNNAVIVVKSTIPLGTTSDFEKLLSRKTDKIFYLVNNPEFLREGSSVNDFLNADRIIIGYRDKFAFDLMEKLYAPLIKKGTKLYKMSNQSAELTKYAANCFLATKISFINEMARICEKTGADISDIRAGMSSDSRISSEFLYPGPGFGGSCFPKDLRALIKSSDQLGESLKIIGATYKVNVEQKLFMFNKIKNYFNSLSGKTIAFWGVAFKANTDDVRESAAIDMANALINDNCSINVYDPFANENFSKVIPSNNIKLFNDMYDCLKGCDALIIMTEWEQFKNPNLENIRLSLKYPVIFDTRNIYDPVCMWESGFEYMAIGRYVMSNRKR